MSHFKGTFIGTLMSYPFFYFMMDGFAASVLFSFVFGFLLCVLWKHMKP